jgi:predicted Zn-dependent protease with MMP-like domain
MFIVDKQSFKSLITKAIANLPKVYRDKLDNVAFIVEDYPSAEQRVQLELLDNQTLFGLYEGVPLTKRQGSLKIIPDKITLFQGPLQSVANNIEELYDRVGRTIWHEVAHYFGLDHQMIDKLNDQEKNQ